MTARRNRRASCGSPGSRNRRGTRRTSLDLFGHIPAELTSDERLIAAYVASARTLDDLPYTEEFERLYASLGGERSGRDRREVFRRLHNLRKAGKLPRLGRAAATAVKVTEEDELLAERLVVERVGTMGQRDQLPYDGRIDDLAQAFNERTGRHLSQHDLWRLVAKIAK